MPAFEYQALDDQGKKTRGILEGDTPRQVRQLLRQQNLSPLSVDEVSSRKLNQTGRRLHVRRLPAKELALITRQLAVLLRSGAPLEEALRNVAQQNQKKAVQRVMGGVRAKVVEGFSLAVAMADYPGVFNELFRSTVAAGEEAGHLEGVLDRLADFAESRQAMAQRLTTALVYPILLTVVAIAVLAGLLGYVVPQVVQVFDAMGQEMPSLTKGLLFVSGLVQQYGLWALLACVVMIFTWRYLMRGRAFRYRAHRMLLGIPMLSTLTKGINSARFSRTLSILAGSGVPILRALEIAARVIPNLPMRAAVEQAAVQVREGGLIHKALEQSGYFPPMTIYLIANGEQTGQLEEMLERAAQQQEKETDTAIGTALALFEPLMILVMGGLVLVIVLAILLPIFEMNQLIG